MASNITLQDIVNSIRAYPELTPILSPGGWTKEPALTIANDVMQIFLAQNLDWKWNRAVVQPFLTVALQQDYIGVGPGPASTVGGGAGYGQGGYGQGGYGGTSNNPSVLDLGWLEQGWRIDINNVTNPKPVFALESVRDLARTSMQANPFNISWVPIPLAQLGVWQPSTAYPSAVGVAMTPASPIQQFQDANGNFLFVSGYGTSGSIQPALPPLSPPGTTVQDGTVTWTVADPNGVAIRLAPLPPLSGIVWQIVPVYQKKPPLLTSLQQTLSPIPDEMGYLFRQGFLAMCKEHASPGSKAAVLARQEWEKALFTALRSGDREREDASMYPSESLMGGSTWKYGAPVGPAWPFDLYGW